MSPARLHVSEAQPVTFVELFFDLVFVFAVTQVTVLTAHHLDAGGIARSLLLFWLIWWAWTQFTWTLNPADTQNSLVRAVTLVAIGAAFVWVRGPRRHDEVVIATDLDAELDALGTAGAVGTTGTELVGGKA